MYTKLTGEWGRALQLSVRQPPIAHAADKHASPVKSVCWPVVHSLSFSCSLFLRGSHHPCRRAPYIGLIHPPSIISSLEAATIWAAVASELVLHLENAVGQGGVQVCIRHLLDAESVQHLVVSLGLQFFELVDRDLSIVDRNEVHQFLVLVNIYVELLDCGRVRVDIFLDCAIRLEERLESRLSEGHLLKLSLLFTLLGFSLVLESLLLSASTKSVHHGLDIEHFSSKLHPGIFERIAPFFDVVGDLLRQLLSDRVRQDALSSITIAVRIDRHIFERHQVQVDLLVVLVRLRVIDRVLSHLLGIFLQKQSGRDHHI